MPTKPVACLSCPLPVGCTYSCTSCACHSFFLECSGTKAALSLDRSLDCMVCLICKINNANFVSCGGVDHTSWPLNVTEISAWCSKEVQKRQRLRLSVMLISNDGLTWMGCAYKTVWEKKQQQGKKFKITLTMSHRIKVTKKEIVFFPLPDRCLCLNVYAYQPNFLRTGNWMENEWRTRQEDVQTTTTRR